MHKYIIPDLTRMPLASQVPTTVSAIITVFLGQNTILEGVSIKEISFWYSLVFIISTDLQAGEPRNLPHFSPHTVSKTSY